MKLEPFEEDAAQKMFSLREMAGQLERFDERGWQNLLMSVRASELLVPSSVPLDILLGYVTGIWSAIQTVRNIEAAARNANPNHGSTHAMLVAQGIVALERIENHGKALGQVFAQHRDVLGGAEEEDAFPRGLEITFIDNDPKQWR